MPIPTGLAAAPIRQMISLAHSHIAAIYNSQAIVMAPEIKASADAWDIENDNLDATHENVLAGQTPGATIYFRVLALDSRLPTGQTDYTPWIAVTVSS